MSDGSRCPIRGWCERMLAAIVLATVATAIHADSPASPRSWRKEVGPDKKYVFVMQVASQGCRPGIRKTITDAELAQLPPQWAVQAGGSRRACDPQQVLWTKRANSQTEEVDARGFRKIT